MVGRVNRHEGRAAVCGYDGGDTVRIVDPVKAEGGSIGNEGAHQRADARVFVGDPV